ncbi:unnamed protein product [Effrenium voratum]|nr:unnamed protein product [Effrenium voratum]
MLWTGMSSQLRSTLMHSWHCAVRNQRREDGSRQPKPTGNVWDFPAPGKHSVLGLKQAFFVGDSRRFTEERGFNVRARLAYRPSPDGCLKGIPFSDLANGLLVCYPQSR